MKTKVCDIKRLLYLLSWRRVAILSVVMGNSSLYELNREAVPIQCQQEKKICDSVSRAA